MQIRKAEQRVGDLPIFADRSVVGAMTPLVGFESDPKNYSDQSFLHITRWRELLIKTARTKFAAPWTTVRRGQGDRARTVVYANVSVDPGRASCHAGNAHRR